MSSSFIRQLPQPHMAHEIGLVFHLQCLSNKQVEEFGSLCGGNQSVAWHTWKPGPCNLDTALIWGCPS